MKLWLFDSGLGGMVVLESFQKHFPDLEILIEMDRKNAPYGDKTSDEIKNLTLQGVENLFEKWADVVILACNTASVHALRWLQTEKMFGKHILGVTIPGAEAILENGYKKVWVLATQATVNIRGYKDRVHLFDDSVKIEEVGTTNLVALIEKNQIDSPEMQKYIEKYIEEFSSDIKALVLGCTHFPLIRSQIEAAWKKIHKMPLPVIIDPGEEAAKKFKDWMKRKKF